MDIRLADSEAGDPFAEAAAREIRKCVHCGMCLATCPTHRLWGREPDSPRGRIYLVKSALERGTPGREMGLHLDRCLTCRACETACPSSVKYEAVARAGRRMDGRAGGRRPLLETAKRAALASLVVRPRLFGALVTLGRPFMRVSPAHARMFRSRPGYAARARREPAKGGRRFALFPGCVQQVAGAPTNEALVKAFAAAGIETEVVDSPCCGAVDEHLGRHRRARRVLRDNIMKVHARLESGELEGVTMAASGCVSVLKEYGSILEGDGELSGKAALLAERAKDPSEVLEAGGEELSKRVTGEGGRVAFHCPCTLQHGMRRPGAVEGLLRKCGFEVDEPEDKEICCGAAGSYFLLYPKPANELRARKLRALQSSGAGRILSSNIGCIMHLRAGTTTPVSHWLEALAERLE